jgi:hypothetical protein
MADDGRKSGVDELLISRVASLSVGSQRWLKTAIQAIRSSEGGQEVGREQARSKRPRRLEAPRAAKPPADLEDVITGKADLREHLEEYPELSKEFEGLADVIDLLRETGERRRRRGEDILRELLEGEGRREDGEERRDDGDETPER